MKQLGCGHCAFYVLCCPNKRGQRLRERVFSLRNFSPRLFGPQSKKFHFLQFTSDRPSLELWLQISRLPRQTCRPPWPLPSLPPLSERLPEKCNLSAHGTPCGIRSVREVFRISSCNFSFPWQHNRCSISHQPAELPRTLLTKPWD